MTIDSETNNNIKIQETNDKMSRMSTSENVLVRLGIVIGMSAAVVTILYLTPMPDQNFKSCDRPCHELDWPMICRVKLNIEMYHTDNHICKDCRKNDSKTLSHCNNIFCQMTEESNPRSIITANRQIPGPAIQVCQNDILIVDVINKIPGKSVTLHWRGQPNNEAPFMDGVPMVTQCPIPSYTTFQYKFRASYAGTHFYHAFTDADRSNGLFGALIVRKAEKLEPHKKLYDVDLKDHTVLISEWSGDFTHPTPSVDIDLTRTLLINGKAPSEKGSSLTVYHVKPGKRHRFRAAFTTGLTACPVTLSIDNHFLKVIELDGNPINPYEVSSLQLAKGERVDFILKAGQEEGAYYMKVRSTCQDNLHGLAVINYENLLLKTNQNKHENTERNKRDNKQISRHFDTSLCKGEIGKVCLTDVKSLSKIKDELKDKEMDKKYYLEIDYRFGEKESNRGGFTDLRTKIYRINNLTFSFPSSPLLTQPMDVPSSLICNQFSQPEKCQSRTICECVHLQTIPLGNTVELVLIEQAGDQDEHVFHFHGNHFYIVGSRQFDRPMTRKEIMKLDENDELVKRNLNNPVKKDTVRVPKYGVVVLRFLADNPGLWMLRDEKSQGWTKGMDMVFEVGERHEMIATPSNFPKCGNYIGPDFFLL